MATKKKKEMVKELNQLFTNSQVLIFTDYRGLKVADITSLRRQLRDKGVKFHVTKNTLAELSANRVGLEDMIPMLDGPTAIAFLGDDIAGASKVLTDYARTSKILQIRGGLMGSKTITADQVSDLTKILSKEQYIAQLMGSMRAPIQNFVNVLNAPLQGFVNVLNAQLNKLKDAGPAATEAVNEIPAEAATEAAAETESPSEAAAATETEAPVETEVEAPADTETESTTEA